MAWLKWTRHARHAGMRVARRLALVLLVGLGHGCSRDDADCLARIGRQTVAKAETLTDEANGRLNAGLHALRAGEKEKEPGVESRVSERLRWDKELHAAKIAVRLVDGGVELRGKVANAEQRQRALELARSTLGVENVVDALEESP